MKVFIVHSGKDREKVEALTRSRLREGLTKPEYLLLNNVPGFWKFDAKKKIKQSNLVLFFVGETSHESKNIDWEIRTAIKLKKEICIIKLDDNNKLNSSLYKKDDYSGEKEIQGKEYTLSEFMDKIKKDTDNDYGLFNVDNFDNETLFEQYKIFLQTSEKVVERRQNVSNFYISVNSAMLGIFGAIGTIGLNITWKLYTGIIIPLIGIILCLSWIRIVKAYGNLNSSKLRIINILEKKMPASLYEAEWKVQTDKLNLKPYISFTESETRIPKVFICIYSIILISLASYLFYLKFFN